MLKFIMGEKGTGKTKALLDAMHSASENEKSSVVFINNGNRHMFDVDYKIRLVDTSEFSLGTLDAVYGLICGVLAQNFDVSDIFIDGLKKMADFDADSLSSFAEKVNALCEKSNINIVITISMDKSAAPASINGYIA